MKLGILINTADNLRIIDGIGREAVARGHQVLLFVMDAGTRLLPDRQFGQLAAIEGISISYCDHSAKELGVETSKLSEELKAGSQYDNATMNHQADKVIVL